MKITLIVLLSVLNLVATAGKKLSEEEINNLFNAVSGINTGIIMEYVDKHWLTHMEKEFRLAVKYQEQSWEKENKEKGKIYFTDAQKIHISVVVKDMYYSEMRLLVKAPFLKMKFAEVALIANAIEKNSAQKETTRLLDEAFTVNTNEISKVFQKHLRLFVVGSVSRQDFIDSYK